MPTRNVNLKRDETALEGEERTFEAKLATLRTAIDDGDSSGIAEGNPFERVRQTLGISANKR